jgi:hypothetical protein
MNDHLIEILHQYLKLESNYAVLLTGWGNVENKKRL